MLKLTNFFKINVKLHLSYGLICCVVDQLQLCKWELLVRFSRTDLQQFKVLIHEHLLIVLVRPQNTFFFWWIFTFGKSLPYVCLDLSCSVLLYCF